MEHLAVTLGLTPAAIEKRLEVLSLGPAERDLLRDASPEIERFADRFIAGLYDRLESTPSTARWFARPETRVRLELQQRRYLHELFTAPIDWPYVLRRLQIGAVHHRVRLSPRWYVATCCHFLCDHVPLLLDTAPNRSVGIERVIVLAKTLLFDAALVLDAYGMSLEQSLRTTLAGDLVDGTAQAQETPAPGQTTSHDAPAFTRLNLGDVDCEERLGFLGLDAAAIAELHRQEPALRAALPAMTGDFYRVFQEWPATRELLSPPVVQRLVQQVSAYWLELARGNFDRPYAASRTRIGIVHERIGVSAPIYLTGLARQLTFLLRSVMNGTGEPAVAANSILRAVFHDTSLVLDAYLDARAESVLRNEGFASRLLASLNVGVAILDTSHRVRSANPALLEFLGVEAGVLRNMAVKDLVPDPRLEEILAQVKSDRSLRRSILVTYGGRHLRVTVHHLAAATEDGSVPPMAVLVEDVTEIVSLAPAVQQVRRNLEHLVSAVDAVLWELDPRDGILSLVSAPVLGLTGYRDVELVGRARAWWELIPDSDRTQFADRCARLDPGERLCLVHRIRHRDGETRWARSQVILSRIDDERSVLRGVSLDVSASFLEERRRLEAVARLAGNVAHEINGVLAVVSGSLTLLDEDGAEDGNSEIRTAQEAVERGAALTRRLQVFAQGAPLRSRPANLNAVIHGVARELHLAATAGAAIEMTLQEDLWPCEIDASHFGHALTNLVANARESMPHGGTIVIETRNVNADEIDLAADVGKFEDHVEVAVTDRGGGMDAIVRSHAVEPGFTTKGDASGLGLSVVHGFVHQSRGHLVIESRERVGTTVRLRFPRVASPEPPRSTVVPEPAPRRRILVVDDDRAFGELLVRILGRRGYQARLAPSPEAAEEAIAAQAPDAILCDVIFGGIPAGPDFGRRLARSHPDLPVAYMSGYTKNALDLAPDALFLPKPFGLPDLQQLLARLFPAEVSEPVKPDHRPPAPTDPTDSAGRRQL